MANVIISAEQLEKLMTNAKPNLNEGKDGEYMTK